METTIEFNFDSTYEGHECIRTVEVRGAPFVPRVGEYVHVEGYRKVLSVSHYYGIVVSNGGNDLRQALRASKVDYAYGNHATVYVKLGPPQKCPRGMC